MNDELYEQYKNDPDFKAYVDAWCKQKNQSIFEAFNYKMVQEYAKREKK